MSTYRFIRTAAPCLLGLAGILFLSVLAGAQSENSDAIAAGKTETSIELLFTAANNHSKILSATVKTKIGDSYQGVEGLVLHFYQTEAVPEQLLGNATTNEKGLAIFVVPTEKIAAGAVEHTFIAALENNDRFEDNAEELSVGEADFSMTLEEADSVRQVVISLQAPDASGALIPVAETEVHLYVQRLFGLLPLSSDPETTDEEGMVTVEFPAGIPGDSLGNLILVARVEDHERFGNLEFRRKINWGDPVILDHSKRIRELWSSRANAPLYLIFFVNTMIISIWGVIAYIVYEVFQIKKLGRQSPS